MREFDQEAVEQAVRHRIGCQSASLFPTEADSDGKRHARRLVARKWRAMAKNHGASCAWDDAMDEVEAEASPRSFLLARHDEDAVWPPVLLAIIVVLVDGLGHLS